ncbi:hypothetical protein MXD62_13145 [Frankia sp. Mgl5]|uniref:hypothetical protein n=1 Tax=Frankia sp. Mgl5 TaxID=2933793 RepID=UPI00200CE955|nr:hypothetical protein [Frankia sp. Mgl5]MCK9928107.1 hypothetical protein [Frankia sp. Mgl5]
MTAPARTRTVRTAAPANPWRTKALDYLRSSRVIVLALSRRNLNLPPDSVIADIAPADDAHGLSVRVRVTLDEYRWECGEHPIRNGWEGCSHRLAVQMVTGWAELGGRWDA